MPPLAQYAQLDPNVATRQQFTDQLVNVPIPEDACEEWRDAAGKLQPVLHKLAYDEAMAPNLQQTYMTPANSKNRIYFMWDFVGRTLGYLYMLPPAVPLADTTDTRRKDMWTDVISRMVMAGGLILDDKPGFLNMLTESAYPDQAGRHPAFSEDILQEAKKMFTEGA